MTPGTWHGLLAQDLEQMALIMHKELGVVPPYSCKPEEWHKLWVDFPGAWKLLVKRFAQRLQESCWSSQDGDIAGDGQLVHLTSDLDGVHTCTDCGKQFASNCGLAVHMAGVHGVRRSAPSYAGRDGICSSCKRGFHTRLRLVYHLSYSSPQCLEWCMLHCEPMTECPALRNRSGIEFRSCLDLCLSLCLCSHWILCRCHRTNQICCPWILSCLPSFLRRLLCHSPIHQLLFLGTTFLLRLVLSCLLRCQLGILPTRWHTHRRLTSRCSRPGHSASFSHRTDIPQIHRYRSMP